MNLLGLLLAYVAAYVGGALVLLRLIIGEWPDLVWPGSRGDWFDAELQRERQPLARRLRALFARDVRTHQDLDPRRIDMTARERADYAMTD